MFQDTATHIVTLIQTVKFVKVFLETKNIVLTHVQELPMQNVGY